MKRLVIILALVTLLPLNAFALDALTEDTMGQITAQSGVSIAIDDVKIYQNIEFLTYTDADGTTDALANVTDPGAGSVSISQLSMMVNINAITAVTAGVPYSPGRNVTGTYTSTFDGTNFAGDAAFIAKALTIDVGEMAVLSEGLTNNDLTFQALGQPALPTTTVAGVRIGLPTVEINQSELTFDVTIGYTGAYNDTKSFGTISIGNNTMTVLDGFIEIAPH